MHTFYCTKLYLNKVDLNEKKKKDRNDMDLTEAEDIKKRTL